MPNLTRNKRQRYIELLLDIQKGRCFYCGNRINELDASLDHLIPRSEGVVEDDFDNLVVCCRPLNYFFGSCSLRLKMQILSDPDFVRIVSKFCLVIDRSCRNR